MAPPPTATARAKDSFTTVTREEVTTDTPTLAHTRPRHGHGHEHRSEGQRGIIAEIIASIYEPGINRGLLILMHFSFLALLASLAIMLWATRGKNVHVLILAIIAASLYAIIVWFVRELDATLMKQQELLDKRE